MLENSSVPQQSSSQPSISQVRGRVLFRHFFRRFFDNDTLTVSGETETTVVRALAFCAVPTLMFAFWLLPSYPTKLLTGIAGGVRWPVEADRYFFPLFSFVAMGVVATFEWEMLFPDKADFLILLPMPLKPRELFYAKGWALLAFLGLFLVAANALSGVFFPAVSTLAHGHYFHAVVAHVAGTLLAGICAAFTILAIEGLVLCLLPAGWFRRVSTVVQCLLITALLLLFLMYPLISGNLKVLMSGDATMARWLPPVWFLGLDESLLLGAAAPMGAWHLAIEGMYATGAVVLLALVTYPLAWARQKKNALEGAAGARTQSRGWLEALLHRTLLRMPEKRAIFHFMTQTITRNPRYQVYLAIYAGAGLALALCCAVTLRADAGHGLALALWQPGLHAVLPLLLFWLVTGLRASFAFPMDMRARWIFPISLRLAPNLSGEADLYAFPGEAAKVAKSWVLIFCGILTAAIVGLLLALHWSYLSLLIQAVCGVGLSLILADLFFLGRTQIPFTRPQLPGRSSLPIVLTLYAALFPALVIAMVNLELLAELNVALVLEILVGIGLLHAALRYLDSLARRGVIGGFPEDEGEEGPQTLGLGL
jgi:hypothetical protein